jgi:histidinol-phosphatase (PHP family)
MLEFIKPYPVEYLILGQHFLRNEEPGEVPSSKQTTEEARLILYVDQVIEGLKTGRFSYLAHPDLIHYVGDDSIYCREMKRLCMAAGELDIPLEINLLGIAEGRQYPKDIFWQIASKCGNTVILGCDAHQPHRMAVPAEIEAALAIVKKYNLHLIEELTLRPVH